MISFHLADRGFDDMVLFVDRAYRLFDLRPLAARIAEIMVTQNRYMRSIGHDRQDQPFLDLAESTLKKRERQGRLGSELAPDGDSSPIITGFRAEPDVRHPDDILIWGRWPDVPWVGYHTFAWGTRPERNAVGMAPYADAMVGEAFEDFIAELMAQTY